MIHCNCVRISSGLSCALLLCCATAQELPELQSPEFRFVPAEGLGLEKGVCRRDPSDVIQAGGIYYVWYTKIRNGPGIFEYPSGYSGTVWYAASKDGLRWTERGEAVAKGPAGAFDDFGVFTPNILVARGKYYLFYDAVRAPMSRQTPTAMGIAVANSPDGPWKKFAGNPVFAPSKDPSRFDSFRVDDACLIVRNRKYWLYYKGRQQGHTPAETKWGLAIAENPLGPYRKVPENPVIRSGHEVLVWLQREGVAALVGPTGPDKNTLQYARDGVHFHVVSHFIHPPAAPGAYRPGAFDGARYGQGILWGISMKGCPDPYLVRFECNFQASQIARENKH